MHSSRLLLIAISLCSAVLCAAADTPAVYTKHCINCHGPDGHGRTAYATKTPVPDLHSAKIQDLSDVELYETIGRGTGHRNYPHAFLYRGLKDSDIRNLVQFIRTMAAAPAK